MANNRPNYRRSSNDRRPQAAPRSNFNTILLIILIALCTIGLAIGGIIFFKHNSGDKLATITAIAPAYQMVQEPYKSCHKQGTTTYVKNNKNGTVGAVVGGTTGAVAGGVIGKQIGGNTAGTLIGGAVGAIGGAYAGDEIQKSNQPDYVAKQGSKTVCKTETRSVKKQLGYTISYTYNDEPGQIVSTNQIAVGTKLPMEQLQSMAVPPSNAPSSN